MQIGTPAFWTAYDRGELSAECPHCGQTKPAIVEQKELRGEPRWTVRCGNPECVAAQMGYVRGQ